MSDKRLVLIVEKLIGKAQMCAVPNRFIHNIYFMHYNIESVVNEAGTGEDLINLNLSKAFDRIDQSILASCSQVSHLRFGLPRVNFALYSGIWSIIQDNGHLSETFSLLRSVSQG